MLITPFTAEAARGNPPSRFEYQAAEATCKQGLQPFAARWERIATASTPSVKDAEEVFWSESEEATRYFGQTLFATFYWHGRRANFRHAGNSRPNDADGYDTNGEWGGDETARDNNNCQHHEYPRWADWEDGAANGANPGPILSAPNQQPMPNQPPQQQQQPHQEQEPDAR